MKQYYIIRKEIVNIGENIITVCHEILKLLMVQTKNLFKLPNIADGGVTRKNDIGSSQDHTTKVKMNLNLLKNSKYFKFNYQ